MNNLRNELGFTQEELAVLLGVSRGLISLYDKGLRSLPKKALEKLSQIQLLVSEAAQKKYGPSRKLLALQQKHRQRAQNLFHAQAKKAAAQAIRASQELAATRERLRKLEAKLHVIQLLLQQEPTASREWRLLQNIEEQLLFIMDASNPASEYAMAYRLSLLISQYEVAVNMRNKLERKNKR